jgi:DNA-binding PadR family transcriptional regulator
MLLSEAPAHPYQIEKLVQERSMRDWTELSKSSIYKTLRQLEGKALVTSEVNLTERNVGRKTYALTEAGREGLRQALIACLSEPEKAMWRIDLATSHLGLLRPEEVELALGSYEAAIRASIASYRELEAYLRADGCPESALALARRPIFLWEGELAWLADFRGLAGAGTSSATPAATPATKGPSSGRETQGGKA